jgi:hypothetical protein
MPKLDWPAILHGPRYLGFRIGLTGVGVGFLAFIIALCGFLWAGVSVCVVGLSTVFAGFFIHMSEVIRRR